MRLLHTRTLDLHEIPFDASPKYAILSHRWEATGEVSFGDLEAGRGPRLAGWEKIKGACARALSDELDYIWIDTCCIDRTSSSELSEAINSMFRWYKNAEICYVHMSDVSPSEDEPGNDHIHRKFMKSMWFTRGWTLQELIAPRNLLFFTRDWTEVGTRRSLSSFISVAAGIVDIEGVDLRKTSVAQRMFWASRRITSRPEDIAYCLMGIFDVNMPLLYGEGSQKAFLRLQLEIIRSTDDESIFAWFQDGERSGVLAESPLAFRNSDKIYRYNFLHREPYHMTNRGLCISVKLFEHFPQGFGGGVKYWKTPLNCSRSLFERSGKRPRQRQQPLWIFLIQRQDLLSTISQDKEKYCRVGPLETTDFMQLFKEQYADEQLRSLLNITAKIEALKRIPNQQIFVHQEDESRWENYYEGSHPEFDTTRREAGRPDLECWHIDFDGASRQKSHYDLLQALEKGRLQRSNSRKQAIESASAASESMVDILLPSS